MTMRNEKQSDACVSFFNYDIGICWIKFQHFIPARLKEEFFLLYM